LKPLKELAEPDLIRRCIQQDTMAQNELYRRFAGKMNGVCLRYSRNRSDAQDILQDAFVKVFVNLSKFKGEGSFEGWIKRIVINTSLKHYQKNLRFRNESDIDQAIELSYDHHIVEKMSAGEIMKCVQQLPDGYRTIFNLYAIEGYQHNEIGELLGISEGTSKSQLSRARGLLVKLINENNKAST